MRSEEPAVGAALRSEGYVDGRRPADAEFRSTGRFEGGSPREVGSVARLEDARATSVRQVRREAAAVIARAARAHAY